MGKVSLSEAKEMLQIFCNKYEFKGTVNDTTNGCMVVSPIWCTDLRRNCALCFSIDGKMEVVTFSIVFGVVENEIACLAYQSSINKSGVLGFTCEITKKERQFMLLKQKSYASDENFFMILYSLLEDGLKILDHNMSSMFADATNPL